ncbi:ferrous iron transport protein B [Lachnoclostridium sp. An169]|uniref:ferrous iron transport protein B n=1 Tax=Lachnoclostridium sp. An169 TaxID=1965569 RepID=UPI000B36ADE8|nr:ferrous iron transport protein B [Lachnoclostridium sp. An169]OUP83844.1 ferrous iron transport protein B [Lachnoclostridium sp. An169]HJA67656.1 ferrous iron transport protein B [Candidatus Mediterraneibacter cottocaccae]
MRIAFAGNPNSGKTTMYNALTGRNERVGNWAGVTVERKESLIKKAYYSGAEELVAVDLPGAYSMSPFTSEESITSSYVKNEHPDAIINIVDATNLSRSLFFTTQLLELGVPVVVALNKSDVTDKKQTKINEKLLSEKLGCPVIKTVSTSSGHEGLKEVVAAAASLRGKGQKAPYVQADIDLTDKNAVEAADRKRFEFVNGIVKQVEQRKVFTKDKNFQDKVDSIITHKIIGIPIFVVVIFLVFYISQTTVGTWIADWLVAWIETFQGWVGGLMENANPLLYALLVDGIIGGVGAVVGFLPLVMVMYFLIALLEDCGYMARATVVLDPIFKRVGLSGKSVIPMVIGTGCAIPGVMACRTIRNERERRTTAMLTPFMPCGAKIPVIALFAGAFFADAWWVSATMYLVGILLVLLGALLVKRITGQKYRKSFFIIELPEYKIPSLKRACVSMLERGKAYIIKAGTIILVCNTVVQIMQTFNWQFQLVEEGAENTSILAGIAHPFAILFIPLGFGVWQLAAAAITGFIAKENVVGTLAVVYGVTNLIDTDELALVGSGSEVATIMGLTKVAALAYLMFNLYTPPCFAALGAMNSEMKSGKWLFGGICLQLATGYTVAFLVYQIGTLITTGSLGTAFVPGLIAVAVFALIIIWRIRKSDKEFASEYSLHTA